MAKSAAGRAGCGCLIFIVVLILVATGLMVHPFSLKLLAGRLSYQDTVVACDAIFVPRFIEDRNGEVYVEAFREYWAGNGKAIYVEDDQVFGFSLKEIVGKMAKDRGIKEDVIRKLDGDAGEIEGARKAREFFAKTGAKRIIIVVPNYAARRFHVLYGPSGGEDKQLFLIKPVGLSYFKMNHWWGSDVSRGLFVREVGGLASLYVARFKYGTGENKKKE